MPNKNKNKKNGLYYFALECREQRGLVGNINEVIGIVYQEWKAMPKEDREPYNRMACDKHDREKQAREAVALTFDPQESIKARRNKATQLIDEMFNQSGYPSFPDFAVNQRWFFMKFITFCRCDIESDYYGYFPYFVLGEVGIVEYSLAYGILNSYHAFIKPNTIPQGYLSKCIESSCDYHKIPYKGKENATLVTKSYVEIYKDIYKFVFGEKYDRNNNTNNDKIVPIFSMNEDIDETKFGLKFLQKQAQAQTEESEKSKRSSTKSLLSFTPCTSYHQYNTSNLSTSRSAFTSTTSMTQSFEGMSEHVYDLECLVMEMSLRNVTFAQADDLLTKYSFDYSPNTKCRYHQEEGTINCALGLVKRKAYLISDHICPLYSISVTPDHLPMQEKVGERIVDEMAELAVLFRRSMRTSTRHKRVSSPSNSSVVVDGRCAFAAAPCYDIRYPPPEKSTITCDLDETSALNEDSIICETKSVKSCESTLFYPESNNANFDSENYIPIEKKSTISTTKQQLEMKTSSSTDSTNIETAISTTTTSLTTITKATIEEEEVEESTTKPSGVSVNSRKQSQQFFDSDHQSTVATVLGDTCNRDDLSVISEEECGELAEGDDWADERDSVIAIAGDGPPNVETLAEFFPTSAAISRGRGRLFADSSSAI